MTFTYYTTAPHIYDAAETQATGLTNICDERGKRYRRVIIPAPVIWQQLKAYEEGQHPALCPEDFSDLKQRRAA